MRPELKPRSISSADESHRPPPSNAPTPAARYYKRIEIPEMKLLEASLVEGALSWHHANNTLVVSYQKPSEVVDLEIKDKAERRKIKTTKDDGDVQCNQQ